MSNFSHRQEGESFNKAPGQEGRNDVGFENLKVKCLQWPEERHTKYLLSKASVAVRGSIVEDDETDEDMANDMFKGGLNQALEWVKVTFECSGVSRGLTHQLVRTRKASFSQQSLRYADLDNFNARMPTAIHEHEGLDKIDPDKYPRLYEMSRGWSLTAQEAWAMAIKLSREVYGFLADHGVPMQDARTVCPIATETYILCNYDLGEFLSLYSYRACQMFYPEMVAIMGLMKKALVEKAPWLEEHIKISCEKTSGGINGLPHRCTYQGWEQVEGQCTFEWALEENRTFKSRKVAG